MDGDRLCIAKQNGAASAVLRCAPADPRIGAGPDGLRFPVAREGPREARVPLTGDDPP